MQKRFLIGALMILSGLGLLTPPAWALFSPLLFSTFGGVAVVTWLIATFCGATLLYGGARRMLVQPIRN